MTGEYLHTIDAKGRVSVPARFREELGASFYVTIGLDGCLFVFSQDKWAGFEADFASRPLAASRHMRPFFANACLCEADGQGRVLLPQKLRDYAGLTRDVAFLGVSTHAEIWDAAAWRALEETELAPENLERVMKELGI